MPESTVVIVGGGAAGLSAAAALKQRGIEAVVLEQDTAIGGTWARRYDRLHLHTVRRFSGLAHYPIPTRYPQYLSRDEVVAYLQEYAAHLGLRVVTGVKVHRVSAPSAGGTDGRWTVSTNGEMWKARVVVVATGQYCVPEVPAWPGRDKYSGTLVHSSAYRNPVPYAGQRVLVVGAGNSGAEIAADVSEQASYVAVSIRTPPPIVPRDPFGMPVQRTSLVLSLLPAAIADRIGQLTARMTLGDLTRHGLPAARFAPYTNRRVPLIDVGFVAAVKRGAVKVKPALERLNPTGAVFAGGQSEPFDVIIAATGFMSGLSSLVDVPGVLDDAGQPLGVSGAPTSRPGLYFVGFAQSLRGHLFETRRASLRLGASVQGYLATQRG